MPQPDFNPQKIPVEGEEPVHRFDTQVDVGAGTENGLTSIGKDGSVDPQATLAEVDRTMRHEQGRYHILRPHARGGLGQVSVAHDSELHREVAFKEILHRFADDEANRQRFVLEAEITGNLEHPGIVPVYSLGQAADGRPYYAMRFIRGDSMQAAIDKHVAAGKSGGVTAKRVSVRQLLRRLIDVCNVMAYAHSRGILHRDLKPDNIMLGTYGETLVVDWGLAKATGATSQEAATGEPTLRPFSGAGTAVTLIGSALGTPAYMSPEQAAGRLDELQATSDIYSLGATLYCLLTGKPPIASKDVGEALRKAQCGDFPPPRQHDAAIARALEAICMKAMSLRPSDRYQSTIEMASDLEHWLADEPITIYREPVLHRTARWGRRHKTLVSSLGALLVTAVLALSIGTIFVSREQALTASALAQLRSARHEQALALVDSLFTADMASLPIILEHLAEVSELVVPRLREIDQRADVSDEDRARINLALLPMEPDRVIALRERLLQCEPQEVLVLRQSLMLNPESCGEELWKTALDSSLAQEKHLRAASALALLDPVDERWNSIGDDIANALIAQNPLLLALWTEALHPVRKFLLPEIERKFVENKNAEDRFLLANLLANYAFDDSALLIRLLAVADAREFDVLLDKLQSHRDEAIAMLMEELHRPEEIPWDDGQNVNSLPSPSMALIEQIENRQGMLEPHFAMVQSLPLDEFSKLARELSLSGYRPRRLRPYRSPSQTFAAAIWVRDQLDWRSEIGLTAEEIHARDAKYRSEGFIAEDVAGYSLTNSVNDEPRFSALWSKQQNPVDYRLLVGLNKSEELEAQKPFTVETNVFDPLIRHEFVTNDGNFLYSSIWKRLPTSAGWRARAGLHELAIDAQLTPSEFPRDLSLTARPKLEGPVNHFLDEADEQELQQYAPFVRTVVKAERDGMEQYGLGHYSEAIDFLTLSLSQFQANAGAYAHRALALARLGRIDEAQADVALCRKYTLELLDEDGVTQNISSRCVMLYADAIVSCYQDMEQSRLQEMDGFVSQNANYALAAFTAAMAYGHCAELLQQRIDETNASSEDRKSRSDLYQLRALELIEQTIALGFENSKEELETHPDLAIVRSLPKYQELVAKLHMERRYGCVWSTATGNVDLRVTLACDADEHLQKARELTALGYRPQSISRSLMANGRLETASLWGRPVIDPETRKSRDQRRGSAALTLMRLGQTAEVWPLLASTSSSAVRTYLIHRLVNIMPDPSALISAFGSEASASAQIAILLALGEYSADSIQPDVSQPFIAALLGMYREHPDPGMHSAIQWLLRQWGKDSELTLAQTSFASHQPVGQRNWFANSQGQTLAVFQPSIEFEMGSPVSEADRLDGERMHVRRIERKFALALTETTVEQYLRFMPDAHYRAGASTGQLTPMIDVTWFDAVKYCRWLSAQEGIAEDQMCYPPIAEIGPAMTLASNFLERTGYRLPTEAEWEFACRAGAKSMFYFSNDASFLDRYARFSSNANGMTGRVASLKPNDYGLFDVLGNVGEWCQGPFESFVRLPLGRATLDQGHQEFGGVVRGGSWLSDPSNLRCARRFAFTRDSRAEDVGFRVARTLPNGSP